MVDSIKYLNGDEVLYTHSWDAYHRSPEGSYYGRSTIDPKRQYPEVIPTLITYPISNIYRINILDLRGLRFAPLGFASAPDIGHRLSTTVQKQAIEK